MLKVYAPFAAVAFMTLASCTPVVVDVLTRFSVTAGLDVDESAGVNVRAIWNVPIAKPCDPMQFTEAVQVAKPERDSVTRTANLALFAFLVSSAVLSVSRSVEPVPERIASVKPMMLPVTDALVVVAAATVGIVARTGAVTSTPN